jgi:hypothetical protein
MGGGYPILDLIIGISVCFSFSTTGFNHINKFYATGTSQY